MHKIILILLLNHFISLVNLFQMHFIRLNHQMQIMNDDHSVKMEKKFYI